VIGSAATDNPAQSGRGFLFDQLGAFLLDDGGEKPG